jgi:hypothetical protein
VPPSLVKFVHGLGRRFAKSTHTDHLVVAVKGTPHIAVREKARPVKHVGQQQRVTDKDGVIAECLAKVSADFGLCAVKGHSGFLSSAARCGHRAALLLILLYHAF